MNPSKLADVNQLIIERNKWIAECVAAAAMIRVGVEKSKLFNQNAGLLEDISRLQSEVKQLKQALSDAAREIPMAGPVANRIRRLRTEHAQQVQSIQNRFSEHQRKAGQSKSPKKLKALAKARKLAAKANRSENPSLGALYQRKRRARLKLKGQSSGVPCTKTASRRRHRPK